MPRKMEYRHSCVVILVFCLGMGFGLRPGTAFSAMRCEYFNETLCNSNNAGIGCNGTEECKPGENEKGNLCYVLWQNSSEGFSIKLKGCWVGSHHDCSDKTRCVETRREPKMQLLFCCCEGDMCNRHIHHLPLTISPPSSGVKPSHKPPVKLASSSSEVLNTIMYALLPLLGVTMFVAFGYWVYRQRKAPYFNEVPTADPTPLPPPSPILGLRPIQLIEIKAQGRFGSVWKAQMLNEYVAVKVFPPQDKSSWAVEHEIYQLPQMQHDNILYFLGSEKRGDNLQTEYWLITTYHEKGSLCDYLKANLVTWTDVLTIAFSIVKGLTHLHEELPPTKGENFKPAVAHRDFKSKNVLLKSDMTACIADFGLALVFKPDRALGEAHGQVGTRRYMAPEVLEGAINFNRDAFLRIDMYACGLVLWELISRCSIQDGPVDEYQLPFEEEVGQHPTLEDMQEAVVHKKIRPKFKDQWKKHPGLLSLCDTIEECWDHDAEARLSASCVQERISFLHRTASASSGTQTVVAGDVRNTTTSSKLPTLIVKLPMQSVPHPKESSI